MPTTTTGAFATRERGALWHGTSTARVPTSASVRREGLARCYRLVLLPRLAFFALWDGVGETSHVLQYCKSP